jgi:hypothetical protein
MATANVNVPDILDKAINAMEAEDVEEDEEVDEDSEDEAAEDDAEEERDLLQYSFSIFGYSANACEVIVVGLNLRVPMDLERFSDTSVVTLAADLLGRHVYRANAVIKLPLTIGDNLHVFKMWATELLWQGVPLTSISLTRWQSFKPELISMSCALPGAAMRATEYAMHDEYLMATIQVKGSHFDTDSETVFNVLWKTVQSSETTMTYMKISRQKRARRQTIVERCWCFSTGVEERRLARRGQRLLAPFSQRRY